MLLESLFITAFKNKILLNFAWYYLIWRSIYFGYWNGTQVSKFYQYKTMYVSTYPFPKFNEGLSKLLLHLRYLTEKNGRIYLSMRKP